MPDAQRSNPWKIGFLILAVAVVLWIGYAVTVPRFAMSWDKANQFGGMFGGIGALFSGLALAGVVVAVLMQREELELQREELRATRDELRRTAEAQERMSAAATQQVNTLLVTAKLNALTAIAEYQGRLHMGGGGPTIEKIEAVLRELEDATD